MRHTYIPQVIRKRRKTEETKIKRVVWFVISSTLRHEWGRG